MREQYRWIALLGVFVLCVVRLAAQTTQPAGFLVQLYTIGTEVDANRVFPFVVSVSNSSGETIRISDDICFRQNDSRPLTGSDDMENPSTQPAGYLIVLHISGIGRGDPMLAGSFDHRIIEDRYIRDNETQLFRQILSDGYFHAGNYTLVAELYKDGTLLTQSKPVTVNINFPVRSRAPGVFGE